MKNYRNFVSESFGGYNKLESKLLSGIEANNLDVVKSAHQEGVNIDFSDGYPMICAAATGKVSIVQYFIDSGTKFKDKGLYYAAGNGRVSVMEILLEAGADTKYMDNGPFLWAVEKNQLKAAELLLQHKVDPDDGIKNSYKALDYAIENGNVPMVKLLTNYGCDITEKNLKRAHQSNYVIYEYLKGIIDQAHGLLNMKPPTFDFQKKEENSKGVYFNFAEFEHIIRENFGAHRIKSKKMDVDAKITKLKFIIDCKFEADYFLIETHNMIREEIKPKLHTFCSGYDMNFSVDAIDESELEVLFTFTRKGEIPSKPQPKVTRNIHNLYKLSVGGNSLTIYPYLIEEILEEKFDFICSYFNYSNQQKNVVFMYENGDYDWNKLVKVRKFLYDNIVHLTKLELNTEEPYLVLNFKFIDPLNVVTA